MFKPTKIELVFENCEVAYVDPFHIYRFVTGDIKTYLSSWNDCTLLDLTEYTNYMELIFNKSIESVNYNGGDDKDHCLVDRLKLRDITSIVFHYEDDNKKIYEKQVYVPWKSADKSGYSNKWQKFFKKTLNKYIGEQYVLIIKGKNNYHYS